MLIYTDVCCSIYNKINTSLFPITTAIELYKKPQYNFILKNNFYKQMINVLMIQ